MYPSVKEVVPSNDFTLLVVFHNGENGILDMKPILGYGVFQQIEDYEDFQTSPGRIRYDRMGLRSRS